MTPDSKGFGPKTKAQIEKALAGLDAKIELNIDADGLRSKVRAAIEAASAGAEVRIGTSLDSDRLRRAVADALAEAGSDVEVDMDLNTDSFERKLAAAAAVVDAIELPVELDSDHLRAEVTAVVKEAEVGQQVRVPVDIGGGGGGDADRVGAAAGGIFGRAVLRSAGRVLAAGALIQLFTAAVSGATALAGGLISATAAAGSLVSTVAALPGLLSAAAQAAGVIALSFSGIGGALKAFTAQQKAIGADIAGGGGQSESSIRSAERSIRNAARAVEDAQRSAADSVESANERIADSIRGVEDAQRGLQDTFESAAAAIEAANDRVAESVEGIADAQQNLADVQASNARRVADAERDVARAHRNVQDAQESLTRSRIEAREEVEDLRRSLARLSLTEDEARRRLAEAQTRRDLERQRAQQDLTGVSEETLRAIERQAALEDRAAANPQVQADNELRDAELDLQEAMEARTDAQVRVADADRNGIENTRTVTDARVRLADAEERLQETIAASARTQVEASRAIVDAQERVVDAQERMVEATKDQTRAQRDAARDIAEAQRRVTDSMRDQTNAQRDLVRAQEDGSRRIADAQESLADAIASAAERAESAAGGAAGAINRYQAALDALGPAQRRFVEFLVSLQPELKRIQNAAAEGFLPGLEDAIRTAIPLLDDFEPIIRKTGVALGQLAKDASTLATTPAWRRDLIAIGERNVSIIKTFGETALRSANLLRNITVAAGPLSSHLADLALHFASVADNAASVAREDGRLAAFFDRVQDRLDKLIVAAQGFATGIGRIFRDAVPEGDRYIDLLTRAGVKFDLLTAQASGSGALAAFFESAREPLAAVGRLVEDLATGLFRIGVDNLPGFTALIEQIRTELLPTLLEVIGTIDADLLSALVSLVTAFSGLFGAILTNNPTLTLFVDTLGGMADAITVLLTEIPLLSPILQGLVTIMGGLAVIGAVQALSSFASSAFGARRALMFLTGSADEAALKLTKTGQVTAALGRAFFIAGIILAAKAAIDALAPSVDKLVKAVTSSKDPLAEFEKQLARLNNPGVFDGIALGIKRAFDDPVKVVLRGLPLIGPVFTALEGPPKKFAVAAETAFRKVAEVSVTSGQKIIDNLKAQGKETGNYERILSDLIDEKAKQTVADEAVNRRVQEQIDKIKGVNRELDNHIEKVKAATDDALRQSGAAIQVEQAIDDLDRSLEENGNTFDIHEQKGRNNKRMLDDLIGSIKAEIEAGGISNDRKRELLGYLDTLTNSGYPGAAREAGNLRDILNSIERVYTATVNLDDEEARRRIIQLERELAAIEHAERPEGDPSRQTGNQAREFGGRVLRNAAYIVGERRPELFIPDQNGVIQPTVPPLSTPKSLASVESAVAMPGNAQWDELLDRLGAFEEVLTNRMVPDQDRRDPFAVDRDPPPPPAPGLTINGPLTTIEQNFGPGANASDIVAAMRAIANEGDAKMLEMIVQLVAAGVGTRGTP